MRFIIFLLFTTTSLSVCGQFFSFQQKWFENESFFKSSAIRENKIEAIHIWQSEKKDGQAFKTERDFLHYEFNKSGRLKASYKSVALRKKVDTATYLFSYNQKGQLYKRLEKQGPFHFAYYFIYKDKQLLKEVKINVANNAIDTTYLHYFEFDSTMLQTRTTVLNALKKPFVYYDKAYNKNGRIIRETKSYRRNQRYLEKKYIFENEQLIKVEKIINGQIEEEILLSRKDQLLELVSFIEDKDVVKKYAFTYHLNGLPKAIIERNLKETKITIYRLEYLFYRD